MAVPDTNSFSMQDVVAEIGSGDDLIELFSLANPAGFDPAYEGSKDNLLNFRNYSHQGEVIIAQSYDPDVDSTTNTISLNILANWQYGQAFVVSEDVTNFSIAFWVRGASNTSGDYDITFNVYEVTTGNTPDFTKPVGVADNVVSYPLPNSNEQYTPYAVFTNKPLVTTKKYAFVISFSNIVNGGSTVSYGSASGGGQPYRLQQSNDNGGTFTNFALSAVLFFKVIKN